MPRQHHFQPLAIRTTGAQHDDAGNPALRRHFNRRHVRRCQDDQFFLEYDLFQQRWVSDGAAHERAL